MSKYQGYTQAVKNANLRYQKEKLERVTAWLQKEQAAEWKNHADLTGESLSAFLKRAVAETMARDRQRIKDALKNAPKNEEE